MTKDEFKDFVKNHKKEIILASSGIALTAVGMVFGVKYIKKLPKRDPIKAFEAAEELYLEDCVEAFKKSEATLFDAVGSLFFSGVSYTEIKDLLGVTMDEVQDILDDLSINPEGFEMLSFS